MVGGEIRVFNDKNFRKLINIKINERKEELIKIVDALRMEIAELKEQLKVFEKDFENMRAGLGYPRSKSSYFE